MLNKTIYLYTNNLYGNEYDLNLNAGVNMKKELIEKAKKLGVDDIGIASIENYNSPNSMDVNELFPYAKNMVVLAFQQVDNLESENSQFASVGIKLVSDFSHHVSYQLANYIKTNFNAKVMIVPSSGPITMSKKTFMPSGFISLRHAAYAAGLGSFGRHNLIIHPEMGSKVVFMAILTDLDLDPDSPLDEVSCTYCDNCVKNCPVNALDEENRTDVMKCLSNSQPYGFGGNKEFCSKFISSTPQEQEKMLNSDDYRLIYQAQALGSQYVCFNCTKTCPLGR
jgi:epoxyqueuosine reductase